MIKEIKKIIENYLNNAKLTAMQDGIVTTDGIKVSDKLTIPNELIRGNLKAFVSSGDKVRLIRNHGGQEAYIVEIISRPFIAKGATITLSREGQNYEYKVEDVRL